MYIMNIIKIQTTVNGMKTLTNTTVYGIIALEVIKMEY